MYIKKEEDFVLSEKNEWSHTDIEIPLSKLNGLAKKINSTEVILHIETNSMGTTLKLEEDFEEEVFSPSCYNCEHGIICKIKKQLEEPLLFLSTFNDSNTHVRLYRAIGENCFTYKKMEEDCG